MRPHVFTTDRDREAARLGEKGFATSYIMDQTGLSAGQVQYRLTKAKIRRADFRNGLTIAARKVAREPISAALDRRLDQLCRSIRKLERRAA